MKTAAKLLIALGVLIVLIAFNMDVSIEGAEVVNINMVSERQNLLIVGCIVFIAGIILIAASSSNKISASNLPDSTESVDSSHVIQHKSDVPNEPNTAFLKKKILAIWNYQDLGGKIIFLSGIMAVLSLGLSWQYIELHGANGSSLMVSKKYVGIANFIVMTLLWGYPIKAILEQSAIKTNILMVCAGLSFAWIAKIYYDFYDFHAFSIHHMNIDEKLLPTVGLGMILAAIASAAFIAGAVAKRLETKTPR